MRVLLALGAKKSDTLEQVLRAAEGDEAAARGVVSAFGWASPNVLRGTVKELLASSDPFKRLIGIAACAVHRVDPGSALAQAIADSDDRLKRRGLRAVGELGRSDLAPLVEAECQSEDVACRFSAAWSSVLTGDRGKGLRVLTSMETPQSVNAPCKWSYARCRQTAQESGFDTCARNNDPERDLLMGVGITGRSVVCSLADCPDGGAGTSAPGR